jgi:hypothetical protein
MAKPTMESAIKREVRTPKYRMRVERDKTKYYRKDKHKGDSKSPLILPKKQQFNTFSLISLL